MRDVKMHVTRAWILEPGFRLQALETQIDVELGADGRGARHAHHAGLGQSLVRRERGARDPRRRARSRRRPDAGEWPFSFKPSDRI